MNNHRKTISLTSLSDLLISAFLSSIARVLFVGKKSSIICTTYPSGNYLFKVNNRNTRTKQIIVFKVNNIIANSLFLTLKIFNTLL